jgi:hypothetical protein
MTDTYNLSGPTKIISDGPSQVYLEDTTSLSGTIWNFSTDADDKLVYGTNVISNIFNLDPSDSTVNAFGFGLATASQKVTLMPHPSTTSYPLVLPQSAPNAGQTLMYNGSTTIFQSLIDIPQHIVTVRTDPQIGQFSDLFSAIASIPTSGPDMPADTNRYVVRVFPGTYAEGGTLVIPSYVFVVGMSMEACKFTPASPGYDLFVLGNTCGIGFISIFDVASPNNAIVFDDVGDFTIIHKIEISNCPRTILCQALTQDALCYLEYVGMAGSSEYGLRCTDNGVNTCFVSIENFFIDEHSDDGMLIDGALTELSGHSCVFESDGTGNCLTLLQGMVNLKGAYIRNWGTAINVPSNTNVHDLLLSGILFDGCTLNLDILSSNTTGHIDGYTEYAKTTIDPACPFFVANQNRNIITVSVRGSNFTSVKSAVDSITTSSATNRYVVYVGPGVYNEDAFTIPPYVTVRGFHRSSTVLVANVATASFITMQYYSALAELRLTNNISYPTTPPVGGILVDYKGDPFGRYFTCQNVNFESSETLARITSDSGPAMGIFYNCVVEAVGNFVTGFRAYDNATTHLPAILFLTSLYYNPFQQQYVNTIINLTSSSPVLGSVRGALNNVFIAKSPPFFTGTCMSVTGGVQLVAQACFFSGLAEGFSVPNSAVAPLVLMFGCAFYNTHDITVSNAATTGTIQAAATRANVSINATGLSTMINGITGDLLLTGDIFQGDTTDQVANISIQLQQASALGTLGGCALTDGGGTDVNVAAGSGYVMIGSIGSDYLSYVTWSAQVLTLPTNVTSWIYIDSTATAQYSSGFPDIRTTVVLGAVKTNASAITYLQCMPKSINHIGSYTDNALKEAIGPIFQNGCISTPNATAFHVDVSSGKYWYGVLLSCRHNRYFNDRLL